ncbi:hypothetical protein GUJ93_ZPchr0003g17947 [Zizania palustris]|uniref:Uncharacterized protein n=1 Tax=Zizania palustris TaxID=103762 RepID=A0A8J5SWB9_ZIZPA|nr:hypothetical protein GUJ93_ZPchr0003g17947 [Zizania palustris]
MLACRRGARAATCTARRGQLSFDLAWGCSLHHDDDEIATRAQISQREEAAAAAAWTRVRARVRAVAAPACQGVLPPGRSPSQAVQANLASDSICKLVQLAGDI